MNKFKVGDSVAFKSNGKIYEGIVTDVYHDDPHYYPFGYLCVLDYNKMWSWGGSATNAWLVEDPFERWVRQVRAKNLTNSGGNNE